VGAYAEALLQIYHNTRIPLHRVWPQSWVAARIDSEVPLIPSQADAGAEVAVLANADLYAGEASVGLEPRRIGNILDDPTVLRWERLDVLPEVFPITRRQNQFQAGNLNRGGIVPMNAPLPANHLESGSTQFT
jgi:hypothetical protein